VALMGLHTLVLIHTFRRIPSISENIIIGLGNDHFTLQGTYETPSPVVGVIALQGFRNKWNGWMGCTTCKSKSHPLSFTNFLTVINEKEVKDNRF
jgi:hypothetical protein